MELIYHFENNVLAGYEIIAPSLLYFGLEDNVDYKELQNMSSASMTGVIKVRDSIMDQLKRLLIMQAF